MHHVDVHVSNLEETRPFLDELFRIVGYTVRSQREGFVAFWRDGVRPSVGFIDGAAVAGSTRLAFGVPTEAAVDAAANAANAYGARNIEGPGIHPEYGNYYAVFFEDRDGNRYEVLLES